MALFTAMAMPGSGIAADLDRQRGAEGHEVACVSAENPSKLGRGGAVLPAPARAELHLGTGRARPDTVPDFRC